MVLQLSRIAMALRLQVPWEALERHVAASPVVIGEEIANFVYDYVRQHQLNYYPALDYFTNQTDIDPQLIEALGNISWVATGMVRNEIRIRMRPVFAAIQYESLQTLVFTMPTVRPGQAEALPRLIRHFTPDVVKVNLNATLIQHFQDAGFAEKMAESMAYRWLQPHFTDVQIASVKYLSS